MNSLDDQTSTVIDGFRGFYPSPQNRQVGGDHYNKMVIQPIEFILENDIGFCEGNAIKYITRHKDKNGAEDIKKAIHYLEFVLKDKYNEDS